MNELEPDASAAMALVRGGVAGYDHHCLYRDEPPEVACARLLCPRRNICLVSLMEQHFLIRALKLAGAILLRAGARYIHKQSIFESPARRRRARMLCGFFHLTPYSPVPTTVVGDR
jgi:hypothetical protein